MFTQKQIISYTVLMCAIVLSFIITMSFLEKNKAESNKNKLQFFTAVENPYDVPDLRLYNIEKREDVLSIMGRNDFKGKAVLLNVWATWCPPCLKELPMLNKLQVKARQENIEVVAVSIGTSSIDDIEDIFQNQNLYNLAAYSDLKKDVRRKLRVHGLPITYVINADAQVVAWVEGVLEWNDKEVFNELVSLVKK